MKQDVVILTRSSKYRNFCVAGVDINTGEWVRLVSDNSVIHGALNKDDITYENGVSCKELDVVTVPINGTASEGHQSENKLINTKKRWEKLGTATIQDIIRIHPVENKRHRYLYGSMREYVGKDEIENIDYSLTFIEVFDLEICQKTNEFTGRPKTKASFIYNNVKYENIAVTDSRYYTMQNGKVSDRAYLVISLTDAPVNDRYYKFVAKIFAVNN